MEHRTVTYTEVEGMCLRKKFERMAVGAGRLFDFSGSFNVLTNYYLCHSSSEIDTRSLESDWSAIGNDFRSVFEKNRLESGVIFAKMKSSEMKDVG